MAGETAQKDLVWVSLDEYSSSREGSRNGSTDGNIYPVEQVDQNEVPSIVLLNGIQLKMKGEEIPFELFPYCLGPMMEGPMKVDWKLITQEPIVSQHILCHKLKQGDSIPDIVAKCNPEYAKALILVNTENAYVVSRSFQWDGMDQPPFPVCVLTELDGNKMLDIVQQQETGEIFGRIEPCSVSEADARKAKSPSPEELSLTLEMTKGKRRIGRPFHKPRVDLKKRLKEIMVPNPSAPPLCVSENQELFQKVMDEFLNYELAAKNKPHDVSDNSRVFQKLIKFIQQSEVFIKDCVFYVVLAYRVFKFQQFYACDEKVQFIHKCISKFEEMSTQLRVDSILKFIDSGNFTIVFDEEYPSSQVFQVMERACLLLMRESQKMRMRGASQQHSSILSKMIWVSVSLKFKSTTGPSSGSSVWNEHVTKEPGCYALDGQSIDNLELGLRYGQQLELPLEAMFRTEQLGPLMASYNCVRPFCQLTEVLKKVEPYLHVPEDFLEFIIVKLREPYRACLEPANKSFEKLSTYGNVLGALQEGLTFLDTVVELWSRNRWSHPSYNREILNWIKLLLGAVDITTDKTPSYLKEFLSQMTHPACGMCQRQIRDQIISEVKKNYSRISLIKFSRLYENYYIWPLEVVQEYLQEYKIPPRKDINDETMVNFFRNIVERFPGAENHGFICDFIQSYRDHYIAEKRPMDLVVHLLTMHIPGLFSVDPTKATATAQGVPKTFTTLLRDHIQRNRLSAAVISHVTAVWKSISHMSEFQLLVLSVLREELIPESRNLQTPIKESIKPILEDTIGHLCYDANWLSEVTAHHQFAFGMVAVCCSRVNVNETLNWMDSYGDVISRLGRIYQSYCTAKGLLREECVISEIPDDIKRIACPSITAYFDWVTHIQLVLAKWKNKFNNKLLNFDEILEYNNFAGAIANVSKAVCATPLLFELEKGEAVRKDYLQLFERLNCQLIKYIPDHPEHGWRLLRDVLTEYGIEISQKVLHYLNQLVIYPGEPRDATLGDTMLHSLPSTFTGAFNPGHNIRLTLTREVTLLQLEKMVKEVDALLAPIKDNIDLLTYFFLRKSAIFDTYLRYQLRKHNAIASGETPPTVQLSISRFRSITGSLMRRNNEPFKGISWDVLASALTETKHLLLKIVEGTAEYTDVTAGGNLDLEKMDVDVEFQVLVDCTKYLKMGPENSSGLHGIQCMLELFQYTNDIQNMYDTCEQYQLDGCLNDPVLLEIKEISDQLLDMSSRDQLTPKEAIEKVNKIVAALHLKKKGLGHDRQCLQIFPAVSDSAVFYQLLKDKGFYGVEGQEVFRQKYELITAQLQHEEYNELVLNHLYAAYKDVLPFLEREQDLESLMKQISEMNNVTGFKELHTVNKNIHLVRLWFSRAEEDTLEMVPAELDAILSTGEYKFYFVSTPDGVKAQLFLEYQPPYIMAAPSPMRPSESQFLPEHPVGSPDENNSMRGHHDSFSSITSSHRESLASLRQGMTSPPPTPARLHKWKSEQIRNFEQRLGFLDPEKSLSVKISKFLALNQSAYKLLELYQRLKDLGHPLYVETDPQRRTSLVGTQLEIQPFREFPCSLSDEETDQFVTEAETQLKDWNIIVSDLHRQYETLLFFSIPKLLHLHQKLSSAHADSVVSEISFLFKNNVIVREKLKTNVKMILPSIKTLAESCNAPMEVVGTFLHKLFVEQEMKRYALQARQPYRQLARTVSAQSTAILHSCHGLSRQQMMSLIINCYNGVPECFQLFRCQASTTEDELNLFLNRVTRHPFQYMMVGVEKLPYQLQELLLQFQLKTVPSLVGNSDAITCLNFVETGPSVLRQMPWIMVKEHKDGTSLNYERAKKIARQGIMAFEDFQCITLVYGHAGDGKSHLIRTRLRNRLRHMVLNIPISEGFTPLSAIKKLQSLPTDTRGCCIYFNFTMLPPSDIVGVHENEKTQYNKLMEVVNWFFFDLLVLGYVEDTTSGESFRLPGGLAWAVFVEVPSRGQHVQPVDSLTQFLDDVPTLGLVCNKEFVEPNRAYVVDEDVQLVCKYLKAYQVGGKNGIDKLYKESRKKPNPNPPVQFSREKDLDREECLSLLDKYTPDHMKKNKTQQKLFIQYMKRRCYFLDNLPAYMYNTGSAEMVVDEKGKSMRNNTKKLGSTLMKAFLREVDEFCDPSTQADWSKKPHQQLIYDTVDGGSSIGLISLRAEKLPEEDSFNFREIGIQLPTMMEMHTRQWLDDYLSRALNTPLDSNGLLKIIDESGYVLTLDYCLKMLNIHERHECGMPVIIEGETGVGKTALIEVLSKLWNASHLNNWRKTRENILEFIVKKMDDLVEISPERKNACLEIVAKLSSGESYDESDIEFLCELPDTHSDSAYFHSVLCKEVLKLKDDPVLSLLEHPETESRKSFNFLFRAAEYKNSTKTTAELVFGVLTARVKNTFHKLNVHAALKPTDVFAFFKEVSDQANDIQDAYNKCKEAMAKMPVPSVTVFLDEVNTASCLGLFKEIIVDRTIDGVDLPENVFVLGACNPHRGDSLAATASDPSWISSNYYVRTLHPTLDMLKWDYGSLDEHQEKDYINAKLRIVEQEMSNVELASLAELIVTSQNLLRAFAFQQLKTLGVNEVDALKCSKSCVSQRDIQRVFTFYEWLMKVYKKYNPHGINEDYHRCAVMVSLAVVYYMRLNTEYREQFSEAMDKSAHLNSGIKFSDTFARELEWYINEMDIPRGIAKTQALKENIFSIILCTMTTTPLIIVGPPGCSKTLSFNLVTANLKGQESKMKLFRDTTLFRSLDPHYYQCSRRTTSNEIQTIFSRAINRQYTYNTVPLPISCVVFMDEAGLPEESLESLKVLHYHLDRKEISFVAISNHMLDAAKTNRAVSLYRSEPSVEELKTLAKGCLCDKPEDPPAELKKDIELITKFCPIYHNFMERPEFRRFYGLRDFIHFVNYLERHRNKGITPDLVLRGLERNFNGHKLFDTICKEFLGVMEPHHRVPRSNILNILKESLFDKPRESLVENPNEKVKEVEVRYKLVIDSSEDNSLLRLLFAFDILKEKDTRTYVCSNFPGDSHQQMINTIAAIRHSAAVGHTVIMSQTDELHESFYDLFNQHFRRIDDPKTGPRFYANIAIGAHHKPCRVHPSFQCVVVVKRSEIDKIPHPFLNRFEKYALTHKILLEAVLSYQPAYLKSVLQRAKEKASDFIKHIGGAESLYGIHDDTLDSLLLSLLPPVGFQEFLETDKPQKEEQVPTDVKPEVFLVRRLLRALRKRAGFRLPHFTREELAADAECVMQLVARDSQFAGQLSVLTCEDVLVAIPEALNGLYHSSSKDRRTDLSINACMIISVFLQWLVRHLCKRLMQLMTTEALTTRYRTLPHRYTESYLKYQSHFNLQALIERQIQVIQLDDTTDRSTTGTANRLLLVTRSSALIHQLPARYPAPNGSSQLSSDYDSLIRKTVYYYTDDVCVYKLSDATTQANINDLLNSFWLSKQRILLMVANMKETSREMISHLRVMIEENDTGEKLKLYVLLLHFPPSMFSTPCYPILFSNTWDHHYLDIIGQNATGQVIDICEWFSLCCSYLSSRHSKQERVPLNLSSILHESIPIISSRVFFGKNEDAPFNCPMEVPQRNKALQQLFDTGVGEILCEKFLKYWEPRVMLEYLEKAASLATTVQNNTLSITDSLQTILRDTFFDFVVHMVSKMNEDMNIDILMSPSCNDSTRKLFLALLRAYPMPKLSQVKTLSSFANSISNVEAFQQATFSPKFPFYRLVSQGLEKIIDQTRKDINQRLDTLHEFPDPSYSLTQMSISSLPKVIEDKSHLVVNMEKDVKFALTEILESNEDNVLSVAIQAMFEDSTLFKRYSEAFTHQKLRLGSSTAGVSFKILRLTFLQLHPEQDLQTRLALLHICMHVYQLDLARLVQVLRPLDTLLDMAAVIPCDPYSVEQPSPTASFLSAVQESGDLLGQPGDLSKYVLKILFSALVGSILGQKTDETSNPEDSLALWYDVYKDVISMPAVRDYLYQNLTELSETQHNIMHAVYLIILAHHDQDDSDIFSMAENVFKTLFNKHFMEKMELNEKQPPRLQEVAEVLVKEINGASVEMALQLSSLVLKQTFEGLFEHFFSVYRQSPNIEDSRWFLTIINKNIQWCSESLNQVKSAGVHESLVGDSPVTRHISLSSSTGEEHDGNGCIPIAVYKHYLSIILDKADISNVGRETRTSLSLYKPWMREMIGKVLVEAKPQVTKTAPYIPVFYQVIPSVTCPKDTENELMQQPLSHLYFITVFHHLLSNNFDIAGLVRVASAIATNLQDGGSKEQQVLLYIEQQAVIQAVIQQLAKNLNPAKPNCISNVATIVTDINLLLNDRTLGGGVNGGHGIALALNLLRELGSVSRFAEFLKPDSMHKDFSCLESLSAKIDMPEEHHLFPFLFSVGKGNVLKDLYVSVGQAMLKAHSSAGRKPQPLISLANEWSQGKLTISLPDGQDVQGDKSGIFRMVFWLNAYHKFFCEKRPSPHLAEMLRNKDHLLYVVQPPEINRLIQCFLDPSLMSQEQGSTQGDSSMFQDPVYMLFHPEKNEDTPSDAALRHALVNLIAVVIASPPTSTHLWYHMFAADQLRNTHLAGFMLETPVGQDETFYDSGVQLTPNGLYGQPSFLKHALRGTLSLQSLYLLLWANAGAFCVGLLTDPEAKGKMLGSVFSEKFALRQFCMNQLRTLWDHLSTSLGISVEERSFLVSRCMWNLLKIGCGSNTTMSAGRFTNIALLNHYESQWHGAVFLPVWSNLKDAFAQHANLYIHQIFKDMQVLETHYPFFPSEDALLQSLLAQTDIGDYVSNTEHIMSQYALYRRQLEVGGELLPDLVELYQWLHQELAHVITRKDAESIPISRAVKVLAKSYSVDEGERLQQLYKRLRDLYNRYREVTCSSLPPLEDSTPLLHALSCSSDREPTPDLLYAVISEIITTHNNFLVKVENAVRSDQNSSLVHHLPGEFSRVHPTEFTDQNCIVQKTKSLHGLSDFAQLICKRSAIPAPVLDLTGSHTSLPGYLPSLINLKALQEDLFAIHLAGKPLIGPPQSLRTRFCFRDAKHHGKENLSAIEADVLTISNTLLDDFKAPMDDQHIRDLKIHFHSASYHTIMETVSGLRGVAGHLIKKLMGISQSELQELQSQSLSAFLSSVFGTQEPLKSITGSKRSVFHEIGIHSLTQNQFNALENICLTHLHDALKWFVTWASQGWYEYCGLPFTMKVPLSEPDSEALHTLPDSYTESNGKLLNDLKGLKLILNHFESNSTITTTALKTPQLPIVEFLSNVGENTKQENLLQHIPTTILMENYVAFHVTIKQLIVQLQKALSSESLSLHPHKKSWEDFVDDLWQNNLSHFRQGKYSYAVVTTSDQKKRVYSLKNINRNDEELLNDLMTAGVSETELLPDTDAEDSGSTSDCISLSDKSPVNVPFQPPTPAKPTYSGQEEDPEASYATAMSAPKKGAVTKRRAEAYSPQQVLDFLTSIGLEEYIPAFKECDISGEILLQAGHGKALEDIGVTNALHRLKISILFRRQLEDISKIAKRYPTEEVVRFLHNNRMSEFVDKFEKNQIDGEMLMEASDEVLDELGVRKHIQKISLRTNFKKYITPRFTTL